MPTQLSNGNTVRIRDDQAAADPQQKALAAPRQEAYEATRQAAPAPQQAKRGRRRSDRLERIHQAASLLFTRQGYQKTTIDDIVQAAGVSKGLYYHYYPDKKSLYIELYNRYCNAACQVVHERINIDDPDIFNRFAELAKRKIELLELMPHASDFLLAAYYEASAEVADDIAATNQAMVEQGRRNISAGINTSALGDKDDVERIIEIISWVSDGFVKKLTAAAEPPLAEDYQQFEAYLNLLRKIGGQKGRQSKQ